MPIFGSQSSINASGYGFLGAKERTIQSTIAPKNLVEGTQITVSVTTDGYPDGTVLYYTVRGNLGTITAADFTDNSLTGTFTINNDSGSFTKTVAADGVIEEGEGFVIDIRAISHTSAVIETTQSVYIQGSQSTGVGNIDDGQGGSTFHDFGSDGNLVFDANTSTSYTYTAATDVKFNAFLWGQGGTLRGGTGGYSYGTFELSQGDALHIRLNYGGGVHGNESGSGVGASGDGGGLAGIFSSSTINQSNARLIAGGGGGGANPVGGSGSVNGGAGGGPSGSSGDNSPDTQQGSTGGGGGTQSGGGGGGGHGGSPGSALAGGRGGDGTGSYPNYAGGGGGGNDDGSGSRSASGGGGGSGYVHSSVINGFTGGFSSGQSNPNRGNAGESGQNSKIVFAGIFAFEYRGSSSNDTYSVNVPAVSSSMTAKVWGAGGAGNGECPASGTGLNPGNFSGGSGGHVEGTIPVTGGSTVTVYVGGSGAGSGSPSMAGSGAGDGGGLSAVKYGSNILVAGGGGGAGQASNGGYGGGNGSGHPGTGGNGGPNSGGGGSQSGGGSGGSYNGDSTSPGSSWNNGSNIVNGGDSGGQGTYQGKRGGGGGSGYYGGGGGGGNNGDCSGGGGGGGSGIINGSWTNTASANGQNGTGGGVSAVDTGDEHYVSGYGGSGQNGLVVLIFS